MIVRNLTVENFRSIGGKAIEPDRRVLIIGKHGAGKSSILDSIRWLLCGLCRGTDAGGRGTAKLVRTGQKQMSVSATIEHKGESKMLVRRFDGTDTSFTATGFHGPSQAQADAALAWLGVSRELLTAILDGDRFFALGHGDAKALLMALLPCSITVPATSDAHEDEVISLEVCDKRYEDAFDRRKVAKQQMKDRPALMPPTEPPGDIPGTEAQIELRRKEREGLVAQRASDQGAAKGAATGSQRALTLAQTRVRQVEDDRKRIVVNDAWTVEDALSRVAVHVEALESLERTIASLVEPGAAETAVGADSYETLLARAVALRKHDPEQGCVMSRDVTCPVKSKRTFSIAAKAAEADAAKLLTAHDARLAREAELAKVQGSIETTTLAIRAWTERADALKQNDVALEIAKKELGDIQGEAAGVPVAPEAQGHPLDAQIADLAARIQKGTSILQAKRERLAQQTAYLARTEERKTLQKAIDEGEAACTLYGPSGVRVAALQGAVGSFEATVNVALKPFGFELTVQVEPWSVVVNGQPYVMLSASEQWRVAIALQCAMAQVSGLGSTLVDQVDMLLPSVRKVLTQLLVLPDGLPLEQVILARAHEGDTSSFAALGGILQVVEL